jgi:tetratricopeptide (TPR) repeat protein
MLLWLALSTAVQASDAARGAPEKLGTVHFGTSCNGAVRPAFERALALLHSFEFSSAISGFEDTLKVDPRCSIAWWGIALSRWGNPFAAGLKPVEQMRLGQRAIEMARARPPHTGRERGYVEAAAALYEEYRRVPQDARFRAYRDATKALASRYPDDAEAQIFYALALAGAADPTDKSYRGQLEAGALLEALFARYPDHPGLAHYIIHAYDLPALAERANEAAQRYAEIAPSAPHALHMPSHTFTRVGAWQESIETNIASAAAARRQGSLAEELHALDYMAYAYLQTGQDAAVEALIARLPGIAAAFDPARVTGAASGSAGVFALAAIPARYALERRDWAAALALQPRPSAFPHTEAMTWFARALGAAQSGALDEARRMLVALDESHERLRGAQEVYWAEQVAIQRDATAAMLLMAEGRAAEAVEAMRAAAAREDATEKNAVTPGPLVPARELLAELLLRRGEPAQALAEFRAVLAKEPDRFRALYGAARAAALAGDRAAASAWYGRLLEICGRADAPGRPELAEARAYLAAPVARATATTQMALVLPSAQILRRPPVSSSAPPTTIAPTPAHSGMLTVSFSSTESSTGPICVSCVSLVKLKPP